MKDEMNKSEIFRQIMALDFTAIDLHLYLNTHPMDQDALMKYNTCVTQCKILRTQYENLYGMISGLGDCSPYPWQWINEPWPWEYEANVMFCREER